MPDVDTAKTFLFFGLRKRVAKTFSYRLDTMDILVREGEASMNSVQKHT
jgi:hypothetical protein